MRKYKKFTFPNRNHIFPYFFFKRILRFKRPKWKFIQKKISFLKRYKRFVGKYRFTRKKFCRLKNLVFLKKRLKEQFIFSNIFLIIFKSLKKKIKNKKIRFFKKKIKFLKNQLRFKKKKLVKNYILLNNYFFNFICLKIKNSRWIRSIRFYKENLLMKSSVIKYFFGCFSISFFKRQLSKKKNYNYSISLFFIKPEYRLDILLWRLKFFISPYLARFAIRNKNIFLFKNLNSFLMPEVILKFNKFLLQGDIIKLSFNYKFKFKQVLNHYLKVIYIPSFIDIDYYTNTIIILKNYTNFIGLDLNTVIKEPLYFYKFKNYILS